MADEAMELFWEDLETDEVHIQDRWQFSLKSEFFPQNGTKPSRNTQEFYLFIPNSLQINTNTYSNASFYLDQTNLIRYKTPQFSFEQLLDEHNLRSPLNRIITLCSQPDNNSRREAFSHELKLLANVVRSTLRREIRLLLSNDGIKNKDFNKKMLHICSYVQILRERYAIAEQKCLDNWRDPLFYRQMLYIDEFMSYSISHYFTGLLENIRLVESSEFKTADETICEILLKEKQLSDLLIKNGKKPVYDGAEEENVLYRYSLLNKFVLDALHLTTNRFSLDERYRHWIGAVSAGVAMMIYFSFFIWLGNIFVINSAPFVLLTVIFYVLKDRIKEWMKNISYIQASRWFPDYTTIIRSEEKKRHVGLIKESFSFIEPPQLSQELKTMRNAEFHSVLETVVRPENILFYKRIVDINTMPVKSRRYGVNVIFRFNIQNFLRKAGNPVETHLMFEPETKELKSIRLPKVYHLNLIIRSKFTEDGTTLKEELKKLRIVIDKNGIKRIEQLSHPKEKLAT